MLALPQEMRLIFTIANNICTLLMPVYKYGIAIFYIYLYIYVYIYICSHTLERDEEKDQPSQEIGLIGELQSLAPKDRTRDSIST